MKQYELSWGSNPVIVSKLKDHLITYERRDDEVVFKDAETNEDLYTLDEVVSIKPSKDPGVLMISALDAGVKLKEREWKLQCIRVDRDTINVSKNSQHNIFEMTFNTDNVSMKEFVEYLITNEYIVETKGPEPGSIMISRSKENPATWVFREEITNRTVKA